MGNKWSEWVSRITNKRNFIILIGLTILNAVLFQVVGGDLLPTGSTLDTLTPIYNAEVAYKAIHKMEEAGRSRYVLLELTVDLAFPLVLSTMLGMWIHIVWDKKINPDSQWNIFTKLPLAGMIVDYIENLGVIVLVLNFPTKFLFLATIVGLLSFAKWMLISLSIIFSLLGTGRKLIKS